MYSGKNGGEVIWRHGFLGQELVVKIFGLFNNFPVSSDPAELSRIVMKEIWEDDEGIHDLSQAIGTFENRGNEAKCIIDL